LVLKLFIGAKVLLLRRDAQSCYPLNGKPFKSQRCFHITAIRAIFHGLDVLLLVVCVIKFRKCEDMWFFAVFLVW